jgi:hypothetical protein
MTGVFGEDFGVLGVLGVLGVRALGVTGLDPLSLLLGLLGLLPGPGDGDGVLAFLGFLGMSDAII